MHCRAQGHLEEMQPQGRAVDKAFKRELGPLPYYPDLLLLYQDRSRGHTYQPDFRMAELDQMLPAASPPPPQDPRMHAPILGYAPAHSSVWMHCYCWMGAALPHTPKVCGVGSFMHVVP